MSATTATLEPPRPVGLLPRPAALFVLGAGPGLSVALLVRGAESFPFAGMLSTALVLALAAWSPLFFSIPALLLQDARDRALNWWGPWWARPAVHLARGLALVPYLSCSPRSRVRPEMVVSLVGLAAGAFLAGPYIELSSLAL